MSRTIVVCEDSQTAVKTAAQHVIAWCHEHPEQGLGVSAGHAFNRFWDQFLGGANDRFVAGQSVVFTDELLGPFSRSYHWAVRHLHASHPGRLRFTSEGVWLPRGCFYHDGHVVTSDRLESMLWNVPEQWSAHTEPGEDGLCPEISIHDGADHPLLRDIRGELQRFGATIKQHPRRLQMVRLGLCGGFSLADRAGGRLGLVGCGAANPHTGVMLVHLPSSLREALSSDLLPYTHGDGEIEPSRHAITLGIGALLHSGALLVSAWGVCKQAVERMCLGEPNALNPAAWVQRHDSVAVFADRASFGDLKSAELQERGWEVNAN